MYSLRKFTVALILSIVVPFSAFAGHHGMKKDIVDVAVANGSFKTLVAADGESLAKAAKKWNEKAKTANNNPLGCRRCGTR